MAASITTQADLLTYAMLTDNEIERLSTARMKDDNWADTHEKAWSLIKGMLLMRRPPLEETDLDDTDELLEATTYATIYCAYQQAVILSDEDKARKNYWYKKMLKAMAEVILTSDSTELGRESYGSRRALRG